MTDWKKETFFEESSKEVGSLEGYVFGGKEVVEVSAKTYKLWGPWEYKGIGIPEGIVWGENGERIYKAMIMIV